eukprot:GHVN01012454.1.p2 GENE.GHVN01012454.1~~GHVN01012454.1.p2  ORF type:complete len:139 (-),score=17.06 GHVN01012454.1:350-766(-)
MKKKNMSFNFVDLSSEIADDVFYFVEKLFSAIRTRRELSLGKLAKWIASTEEGSLGHIIGTALVSDEVVCAVSTLIPFTDEKAAPAYPLWKEIEQALKNTEFPLEKCRSIALLINERIVNIPLEATLPLYTFLKKRHR